MIQSNNKQSGHINADMWDSMSLISNTLKERLRYKAPHIGRNYFPAVLFAAEGANTGHDLMTPYRIIAGINCDVQLLLLYFLHYYSDHKSAFKEQSRIHLLLSLYGN
jgi:hypothetical protein